MAYKPNDFYAQKARNENFAARSVYKLMEIDAKHKLFRRGDMVLDLGAAPGSWSQYVSNKISPAGKILAVDLKPISLQLPNITFIQCDIFSPEFKDFVIQFIHENSPSSKPSNHSIIHSSQHSNNPTLQHSNIPLINHSFFNNIISDMAPDTTGNKFTNQARSFDLCHTAWDIAKEFLKQGGNFIFKIFDGEDVRSLRDELKGYFHELYIMRPKSTQRSSAEMFFICKSFQMKKQES